MKKLFALLGNQIANYLATQFTENALPISLQLNKTDFEGDLTLVLFNLAKHYKTSPQQLGQEIGAYLQQNNLWISACHVVHGFLNISIDAAHWMECFQHKALLEDALKIDSPSRIMLEFSSPNTNKPLHLGHLRNNFLGVSIYRILQAVGHQVSSSCIVNDRGIHICKSMWAWQHLSGGETPESSGMKGDHLVGKYYVEFERILQQEVKQLRTEIETLESSHPNVHIEGIRQQISKEVDRNKKITLEKQLTELLKNETPCMKEVRQMLLDWERGEEELMAVWRKMNRWVYDGFEVSYKKIGTSFDKIYYESNTYLLGKKFVQQELNRGALQQRADASVWIDLTQEGLDQKILLRSDGTSVYITQDLGLAEEKYKDFPYEESIYVVGDEQNYHFQVLKLILEKTHKSYAKGIYHLSYGMVELPSGKMKSREGTVVDADELIAQMEAIAEEKTKLLGKTSSFDETSLKKLYEQIGLSALKFFILKVNPKKKMLFDPQESIDFEGFTGPFIQYTYVRMLSVLEKNKFKPQVSPAPASLVPLEKELVKLILAYPDSVQQAALERDPSHLAHFIYTLAKTYNSFYAQHNIMNTVDAELKQFRLQLSFDASQILFHGLYLLGIQAPNKM